MALTKDNQIRFNRQHPPSTCASDAFNAMGGRVVNRDLLGIALGAILFPMGHIDKAWFTAAIERSKYGSQRRLAPFLKNRNGVPVTQSNFSRMLSGERAMLLHEAQQLAKLLDVPLTEVLVHAGVKMHDRAMSPEEFAKRLRSAGRGRTAGLVVDLLRSLGYGDGADVLEQEKPKSAKAS